MTAMAEATVATAPTLAAPVQSALLRAEVYRLLATAFGYPDAAELAELFSDAEAEARATGQVEAMRLAQALGQALDARVAGEYNRLFAQAVAVSPYETSYVAADKGVQLGRLAALMAAFGVRSRGVEHESPDHIGSELEFMSFLCLKEAMLASDITAEGQEAYRAVREAQALFLGEHLGAWASTLSARLRQGTAHPFYQLAGASLEEWVTRDLTENGWQRPEHAARRRLPLIQPDGSLAPEGGDELDADALSCPMAQPEAPATAWDEPAGVEDSLT